MKEKANRIEVVVLAVAVVIGLIYAVVGFYYSHDDSWKDEIRNAGYEEGFEKGYDNGYSDGIYDGYSDAYYDGYIDGYHDGYSEGYMDGKQEAGRD